MYFISITFFNHHSFLILSCRLDCNIYNPTDKKKLHLLVWYLYIITRLQVLFLTALEATFCTRAPPSKVFITSVVISSCSVIDGNWLKNFASSLIVLHFYYLNLEASAPLSLCLVCFFPTEYLNIKLKEGEYLFLSTTATLFSFRYVVFAS